MEYTYHTFRFPDDYDGPVVATLIEAPAPRPSAKAVLYIHGYIDYFFQDHLAEAFTGRGYNFYAVDLRKYGRSLLPGQHPDYCRTLREYYPDLTESLRFIAELGNRDIVLLGHSTGGLLSALYADDGDLRQSISKVVLNSPFLEFNVSGFKKRIEIPAAAALSYFLPFIHKSNELSPWYARSVHAAYQGEWDFNTDYKPIDGIPLYFAWLGAIRNAQQRLHNGLSTPVPTLVLSSDRSYFGTAWSDELFCSDAVLNVRDIEKYAPCVGKEVTYRQIAGGMHDLFLSPRPVRDEAMRVMFDWLEKP